MKTNDGNVKWNLDNTHRDCITMNAAKRNTVVPNAYNIYDTKSMYT